MTVALYIRVSTDEQAEHGYSLDAQKERLILSCQSQGWLDYKVYMDDGYTGTNLERPALKRMLRHIDEGKISSVFVYKLDRLSRRQKDILELIEDRFEKNNVSFSSHQEKIDTSTAFGKAMLGVLAVFAQLDRDMIVERLTVGRRQRVSLGKWYGGREPFGYSWNKELQQLEIKADEARIIKEIFNMYVDGQSRLSIAEWASKRTTERVIDHNIVRDILTRPVYKGKFNNAGKTVDGLHDAIISEELWEQAQKETLRRRNGISARGDFLLTGLLKCGVCGGNIVHVKRRSVKGQKEYLYELYACTHQHVRPKNSDHICSMGYIRRSAVEEFVVDNIKHLSVYPNKLKDRLTSKLENQEGETALQQMKVQLNKVNTNLENLYDAIQNGDIKAAAVRDRIKNLEEQREAIESDIDDIIDNSPNNLSIDDSIDLLKTIGDNWDYLTEDEQKIAIRKVIKCVVLNGKKEDPTIEWNFFD